MRSSDDDEDASCVSSSSLSSVRFKCPARHRWRCRRRVDMIIVMAAGDAEDVWT